MYLRGPLLRPTTALVSSELAKINSKYDFVGLKFDLCEMQSFEVGDSSIFVIPLNSETEMFGPLLQFNTNFCTNKLNPAFT